VVGGTTSVSERVVSSSEDHRGGHWVYDGKGEIVDNSEKTCCEDVESGGS